MGLAGNEFTSSQSILCSGCNLFICSVFLYLWIGLSERWGGCRTRGGCVWGIGHSLSPLPLLKSKKPNRQIPKVHIIQAAKPRVCGAPSGMHLDAHWVGFAPWDSFPLGICLLRVCRCLWGFTSFHHEPVYFSVKRNKAGPTIHGANYWWRLLNEGGLWVNWHFMGNFCCCYMGYLVFQALKWTCRGLGGKEWEGKGGKRLM